VPVRRCFFFFTWRHTPHWPASTEGSCPPPLHFAVVTPLCRLDPPLSSATPPNWGWDEGRCLLKNSRKSVPIILRPSPRGEAAPNAVKLLDGIPSVFQNLILVRCECWLKAPPQSSSTTTEASFYRRPPPPDRRSTPVSSGGTNPGPISRTAYPWWCPLASSSSASASASSLVSKRRTGA
jgi:hypothetical protein